MYTAEKFAPFLYWYDNHSILARILKYMYFLDIKDIGNNKKNFYRNVGLFDKIFVSIPSVHNGIKEINFDELKNYFNYKVEFDLILLNNIK